MQGKADHKDILEITLEEEIKRLRAEVGNLKVQNAEYSQIVGELSNKLKAYSEKYGSVFVKKT